MLRADILKVEDMGQILARYEAELRLMSAIGDPRNDTALQQLWIENSIFLCKSLSLNRSHHPRLLPSL